MRKHLATLRALGLAVYRSRGGWTIRSRYSEVWVGDPKQLLDAGITLAMEGVA